MKLIYAKSLDSLGLERNAKNLMMSFIREDFGRYYNQRPIAKGSSSVAFVANDRETSKFVVIKVPINCTSPRKSVKTETDILTFLNHEDKNNIFGVVELLDQIIWQKRMCLVFEGLSCSIYDIVSDLKFCGLSLSFIRRVGQQLCASIAFLYYKNVVHCDLSLKNIVVEENKTYKIKIIDFGSACLSFSPKIVGFSQATNYTAPEALLGYPCSHATDVWSIACLLFELHTGERLFRAANEVEYFSRIVELLGIPPSHLLDESKRTTFFFKKSVSGSYQLKNNKYRESFKPGSKRLYDLFRAVNYNGKPMRVIGEENPKDSDFFAFEDLILKMLSYDPCMRITAVEALKHEFFYDKYSPVFDGLIMPLDILSDYSSKLRASKDFKGLDWGDDASYIWSDLDNPQGTLTTLKKSTMSSSNLITVPLTGPNTSSDYISGGIKPNELVFRLVNDNKFTVALKVASDVAPEDHQQLGDTSMEEESDESHCSSALSLRQRVASPQDGFFQTETTTSFSDVFDNEIESVVAATSRIHLTDSEVSGCSSSPLDLRVALVPRDQEEMDCRLDVVETEVIKPPHYPSTSETD